MGLTQLPIAIAPFRGEADAAEDRRHRPGRPGAQRPVPRDRRRRAPALDETSRPDLSPWRQKGADSLAVGSVTRLADGRYDVRFRLWDVVRGQDLGGQGFVVVAADLRLAAHRIADLIYEKLTGEKGVFSTRIAYVTKAGTRYNLWVADADGENAQSALASGRADHLAGLVGQRRRSWPTCRSSRASRWSTCTRWPAASAADRQLPRLQQRAGLVARRPHAGRDAVARRRLAAVHDRGQRRRAAAPDAVSGIDTEPLFSADGRSIYFVSDRGGAPQIYRMPAMAAASRSASPLRVYNISPGPQSRRRWLAYISRISGAFKLQVMELGHAATSSRSRTPPPTKARASRPTAA